MIPSFYLFHFFLFLFLKLYFCLISVPISFVYMDGGSKCYVKFNLHVYACKSSLNGDEESLLERVKVLIFLFLVWDIEIYLGFADIIQLPAVFNVLQKMKHRFGCPDEYPTCMFLYVTIFGALFLRLILCHVHVCTQ